MTIKEYQKDLNKDVSNFLTELQQKFPDMVITSGFRKNSVTKFGKKSRHSTGEAVDLRINPEISDWLYNTKEGITTLNKYGLGMLDESLPENKKFGNAIHIGKDVVPIEKTRNRYKELFGVEYGQEPQPQEQENVINYVSPTQDTTIVTNLPKSEESINFAEETRKLEQQKQEEFQKIEQEINQRTQVQQQEQQIEEEEYVQPTPQVNYQDIFNQVSQFVDTPIAQQGVTWSKQQQALKEEKLAKLKKLLEQENPVYKKKTIDEKLAEKKQEQETKVVAKDNTANRNYNDATKHSNVARNKTNKEIAEERQARIDAQAKANEQPFDWSNFRQSLADRSQATGDALRVSNEPNFFDDYLNPASMIGSMADNLGQAPLRAQQEDSFMPYVTAIGTPLVTGALGGVGTNGSTKQFVNNLANPLAGTGDLAKGLYNKVAQGETFIPYAWKSPAVGLTQEQSYNMFNKIKGGENITEADKVLLAEYQYDSKPFTGRGGWLEKEKQDKLNELIKNNPSTFQENTVLTRRVNPENKELFSVENNRLNLENRPTSFSAGVGIENYGSKANDRIVLSGKNAQNLQSKMLKNNYSEILDSTYDNINNFTTVTDPGFTGRTKIFPNGDKIEPLGEGFIRNLKKTEIEKEIIGTNLNLKRIGKVKNDIGGYDHIMKPYAYGGNLKQQTNNNMLNKFNEGGTHAQNQLGGIKIDPMGYWNPENIGSPIVIPSNRISMKNLDFSVLGVADTGETKLMHPNEEHYFSGAKKVTEYPIEYIKKLKNGR